MSERYGDGFKVPACPECGAGPYRDPDAWADRVVADPSYGYLVICRRLHPTFYSFELSPEQRAEVDRRLGIDRLRASGVGRAPPSDS